MRPRGDSTALATRAHARAQSTRTLPHGTCNRAPLLRLLVAGLLPPWLALGDSAGPRDRTTHGGASPGWPAARCCITTIPEAGAAHRAKWRHAARRSDQIWRYTRCARKSEPPTGWRAVDPRPAGAHDPAGPQTQGQHGCGDWRLRIGTKCTRAAENSRCECSCTKCSRRAGEPTDEPPGTGEGVANGGGTAAEELRAAPIERRRCIIGGRAGCGGRWLGQRTGGGRES